MIELTWKEEEQQKEFNNTPPLTFNLNFNLYNQVKKQD